MRRALSLLLAALVATVAVVGIGVVLGDHGSGPATEPAVAEPVRLSELTGPAEQADGLPAARTVPREPFCARLGGAVVTDALGTSAADVEAWSNGDRAQLTRDLHDVAHEHGCRWRSAEGGAVEAWVFAPPVNAGRAVELAREARAAPGCRPLAAAATTGALGDPSVALLCRADGELAASYRGLVGDAWLTCRVARPRRTASATDLADRADRWCGAVLEAASAES